MQHAPKHGSRCFTNWSFLSLNTASPGQGSHFMYLLKQMWKKRGRLFLLHLLNSSYHSFTMDGKPESVMKKSYVLTTLFLAHPVGFE